MLGLDGGVGREVRILAIFLEHPVVIFSINDNSVPGDTVQSLLSQCERRIEHMIRKTTSQDKDPVCRSLVSLTEDQLELVAKVSDWVEMIPPGVVSQMFSRVISYDGDDDRKMTPMDVWAFMHPGFKQVSYHSKLFSFNLTSLKISIPRKEGNYKPLPNTHKAIIDSLYKAEYLEHLNISGLDHTAVASDHNDITYSDELLEHYLYIITDNISNLSNLVTLNLGSLCNNNILRVISNTCKNLKELRFRGPCSVTDLGVRYIHRK